MDDIEFLGVLTQVAHHADACADKALERDSVSWQQAKWVCKMQNVLAVHATGMSKSSRTHDVDECLSKLAIDASSLSMKLALM